MARSFNGTDKLVTANNVPSFANGDSITIAQWAMVTGGAGAIRALFRTNSGSGQLYSYVNNTNKYSPLLVDTSFTPTTNVWFHAGFVGAINNSVAQTFTAYANGSNVGTTTTTQTLAAVPWAVGADSFSQPLQGNTADFAVWKAALTAGEMVALSNGARPGNIRPASLLLWLPIDGIQSTEPDYSGQANTGTLTGTAPAFGPPLMQFTPLWPQGVSATPAVIFPFQVEMGQTYRRISTIAY